MGEKSKAGYRRAKAGGYDQDYGNTFAWDSDWFQLGGVAVIDRQGRLRYLKRHDDASDQADIPEVLAICRRLRAASDQ